MPSGEYKDFEDCVNQNKDKASPEAYCGEIQARTEKECLCKIRVLKSDDGEFLIYGPASVEVVDREGDKIRASALQVSLPQLLRRGRLSLAHEDIIVGEILPERNVEGKIYKTEVLKNRLMVLGNVWDDTKASRTAREKIERGIYKSYSISGEALEVQKICDSSGCYRDIAKLDSHAVTICEKGMNQLASFDVLKKADGAIEYITIATPHSHHMQNSIHASEKETEVHKTMAEDTKPPAEAKKEAEPGAAPPAGNGGLEAKIDQMMQMMQQIMGGMGKAQEPAPAVPPAAEAQKAAEPAQAAPAAPAQAPAEKSVTKADVELWVKEAFAKMVSIEPAGTTPRPEIKKQHAIDGGRKAEIMANPELLDKMSIAELKEVMEA